MIDIIQSPLFFSLQTCLMPLEAYVMMLTDSYLPSSHRRCDEAMLLPLPVKGEFRRARSKLDMSSHDRRD